MAVAANIAPPVIEFDYVGQLYRAIRVGFETLGMQGVKLFLGRPELQSNDDWTGGLRIDAITSVASARAAVDFIIAQGEGTPSAGANSHVATFLRIVKEHTELAAADPTFVAARNIVSNPVTRGGSTAAQTLLPSASPARAVAELFNHVYESMLMLLTGYFDPAGESLEQRAFIQATARRVMSGIVRPLAEELTQLPVPGTQLCAGAPFEIYGDVRLPADPRARWQIVAERFEVERDEARRLARWEPALTRCRFVADSLEYLITNWKSAVAHEGA